MHQAAMYEIDDKARTCKKKPLKADFHPMEIPINSTLVGQAVLGSSSGPGEGLLVNTWTGNLPGNTGELASNVQNCHPDCLSALCLWTHFMSVLPGKYLTTFTEFGCIPVNTMYQTQEYGWMVTGFVSSQVYSVKNIEWNTFACVQVKAVSLFFFLCSPASSTTSLGFLTPVSSTPPTSAQQRWRRMESSLKISSACSLSCSEGFGGFLPYAVHWDHQCCKLALYK